MARTVSVRRRSRATARSARGHSLTAASQRITDPSRSFRATLVSSTEGDKRWQEQAWEYLDKVGELRYYVNWRSSSASRCRLVASEVDPLTREPTGTTDNAAVVEIVQAIAGGAAGQTQMLARMTGLLTVPGEGYLAVVVRDPAREQTIDHERPVPGDNGVPEELVEEWFTLSRDEIKRNNANNSVDFVLPDGTRHAFDADVDSLVRVWNPSLRHAAQPDSPVHANIAPLNEIVRATDTIDNASKSRLVGNGVMFVPQEMSLPSALSPTAAPSDAPDPTTPATPQYEPGGAQQLQDLLYEVATTAYADQSSLAAFLPIIAAAPGEWIKNVLHLRLDSTVPETALKTRDSAMQRLARGLDVSPERLLGLGTSNHWSAWQIDENDVRVHVAPPVEVVCAALTRDILRPALIEAGLDPEAFVVWYDATELTQDPDKTDEAREAHDRGALRSAALRKFLGFDDADGYDLTTRAGWEELARDRAAADVSLIPLLAPLLGADVEGVEAPVTSQPQIVEGETEQPTGEEPPEQTEPAPAAPPGGSLAALRTLCANRALDLAAKRRRHRADDALYRRMSDLYLVHEHLPPMPLHDALAAIEGWDTGVESELLVAMGVADPDTFRRSVVAAAVDTLTGAR